MEHMGNCVVLFFLIRYYSLFLSPPRSGLRWYSQFRCWCCGLIHFYTTCRVLHLQSVKRGAVIFICSIKGWNYDLIDDLIFICTPLQVPNGQLSWTILFIFFVQHMYFSSSCLGSRKKKPWGWPQSMNGETCSQPNSVKARHRLVDKDSPVMDRDIPHEQKYA